MTAIIIDQDVVSELRRHREETGADRWDETWDGVYVMGAMPNDEHQGIVGKLTTILTLTVELDGKGLVRPGVNVSDRRDRWKDNYRCPDVVVYLFGNRAENRGTHWFGGPDLAIEVVSPGEDPRAKLDFYAKVGTRELLVIDRSPWQLTVFRLVDGVLIEADRSTAAESESSPPLASEVVPFTWRLTAGAGRPRVEIVCTETGQVWHA